MFDLNESADLQVLKKKTKKKQQAKIMNSMIKV